MLTTCQRIRSLIEMAVNACQYLAASSRIHGCAGHGRHACHGLPRQGREGSQTRQLRLRRARPQHLGGEESVEGSELFLLFWDVEGSPRKVTGCFSCILLPFVSIYFLCRRVFFLNTTVRLCRPLFSVDWDRLAPYLRMLCALWIVAL